MARFHVQIDCETNEEVQIAYTPEEEIEADTAALNPAEVQPDLLEEARSRVEKATTITALKSAVLDVLDASWP